MTRLQENIESLNRVLNSYAGRDKFVRTLSFLLTLKAQSSPNKKALLALAKQCSAARLVLRQFNHPSMLKSCQQLLVSESADSIDYACSAAVTGIYTVYGFVELFAWLSDANIVAMDSTRLFRYCLYLWIAALIAGIIRQIRILYKRGCKYANDDMLTFFGLVSDFIVGINSLPQEVLWSGKLSSSQSATFSLIASFIGLYKMF